MRDYEHEYTWDGEPADLKLIVGNTSGHSDHIVATELNESWGGRLAQQITLPFTTAEQFVLHVREVIWNKRTLSLTLVMKDDERLFIQMKCAYAAFFDVQTSSGVYYDRRQRFVWENPTRVGMVGLTRLWNDLCADWSDPRADLNDFDGRDDLKLFDEGFEQAGLLLVNNYTGNRFEPRWWREAAQQDGLNVGLYAQIDLTGGWGDYDPLIAKANMEYVRRDCKDLPYWHLDEDTECVIVALYASFEDALIGKMTAAGEKLLHVAREINEILCREGDAPYLDDSIYYQMRADAEREYIIDNWQIEAAHLGYDSDDLRALMDDHLNSAAIDGVILDAFFELYEDDLYGQNSDAFMTDDQWQRVLTNIFGAPPTDDQYDEEQYDEDDVVDNTTPISAVDADAFQYVEGYWKDAPSWNFADALWYRLPEFTPVRLINELVDACDVWVPNWKQGALMLIPFTSWNLMLSGWLLNRKES